MTPSRTSNVPLGRTARSVYEVERDRFGVTYSGPLEVGECIEVMPAAEYEALREAAEWVVLAWDNEQSQHGTMGRLREALGWPSERPSREEARRRMNAKCGIEASAEEARDV